MAWRINEQVIEGEIDNREYGRVSGWLRLTDGRCLRLNLAGNACADIAGTRLRFRNPSPVEGSLEGLDLEQNGQAGEITASRRVQTLSLPWEIFRVLSQTEKDRARQWANALYLEWFNPANGRVVVESADFVMEVIDGPLWALEEDGEGFEDGDEDGDEDEGGDGGIADFEAEMEAQAARMELLHDRIEERLRASDDGEADWERIYEEEDARLREERGEPEPEEGILTPQQEETLAAWIEKIDAADEEKMAHDATAPSLVTDCRDFALRLRRECERPPDASSEHPICELLDSVSIAAGKLAAALGRNGEPEWPPDLIQAPVVLIFLKKARGSLEDALLAVDSLEEAELGPREWRAKTRSKIEHLLRETRRLIREARETL